MRSRRIALVLGVLAAFAALSLSPLVSSRIRQASLESSLPVLYTVPEFRFTDSTGRPFGLADLKGKVWVVDFIFTTCTGPCPVMSGQMADLYRQFKDTPDIHFVSISVDPETDTPEVLAQYGESLGADPSRWHFLNAPIGDVNKLAFEGFKIGAADTPLLHDLHFILVDGQGRVRGYYTGTDDAEVDHLREALELLVKGSPS